MIRPTVILGKKRLVIKMGLINKRHSSICLSYNSYGLPQMFAVRTPMYSQLPVHVLILTPTGDLPAPGELWGGGATVHFRCCVKLNEEKESKKQQHRRKRGPLPPTSWASLKTLLIELQGGATSAKQERLAHKESKRRAIQRIKASAGLLQNHF